MKTNKQIIIIGFVIFASLFGAGNLILPPFLGFQAGEDWWLVAIGFLISATVIPFLAILAHSRLQGTMLDFGKKVSPLFSLIYCLAVYGISISLPIPRTAAVTHEMAIAPYFETSPFLTSTVYFALVLIFAINRNSILDLLGKFLTPVILVVLLSIIGMGIWTTPVEIHPSSFDRPVIAGLLEGYQTYDALAGVVIGGVVIISLNRRGKGTFGKKKRIIFKSGLLATGMLALIYGGLIAIGAFYNSEFDSEISRTALLGGLGVKTLGNIGQLLLSVLMAVACFTTAVSVVVGTSDFVKGLFKESQTAYTITAIVACALGILVGQFNVKYIIDIALPVLLLIYPVTIVLILLNLFPRKFASKRVFKVVVATTLLFSFLEVVHYLTGWDFLLTVQEFIPFSEYSLGWVLPALFALIVNLIPNKKWLKSRRGINTYLLKRKVR